MYDEDRAEVSARSFSIVRQSGKLVPFDGKIYLLRVLLVCLGEKYYKKINIPKKYIKYSQILYYKNFTFGNFADILI